MPWHSFRPAFDKLLIYKNKLIKQGIAEGSALRKPGMRHRMRPEIRLKKVQKIHHS
jgi:hypothetical protein